MDNIVVYFEGDIVPKTKKWLTVKVPLSLFCRVYYEKNTENMKYEYITPIQSEYLLYMERIDINKIVYFIYSYYSKNSLSLNEEEIELLKKGKSLLKVINTTITLVNNSKVVELYDFDKIKNEKFAFILNTGTKQTGKVINENYVSLSFTFSNLYTSMDDVMIL